MITVFTDGGCDINRRGAKNSGGFAYVIINDSGIKIREFVNKYPNTTNNQMELMAVVSALNAVKDLKEDIVIHSDSKYVVDSINLKWINKWQTKGFSKKNGTEFIPNAPWWKEIWEILLTRPNITFKWVKAHTNTNTWNDYVDKLVQSVYQKNFTVIN